MKNFVPCPYLHQPKINIMKAITILPVFLLIIASGSIRAQSIIVTLNPSKDAMIRYFDHSGDSLNHGDYQFINMHAWTNDGKYVVHRSMIDFDLSSISADSLASATLKLFSDKHSTFYPEGHQYMQEWPLNDLMVYRIVGDWDEYTVSWINRPDVSFKNEVHVPNSSDSFQDYEIDVTKMVRDMLLSPEISHGFMIQLWVESYYNRVVFASSDNPNEDIHPRLELQFEALGMKEREMARQFRVFPNPARDEIRIELRDAISGAKRLEIIDITGRNVFSLTNLTKTKIHVDISSLAPGLYWIRLFDNSEILVGIRRLILQ